jgi:transposase-like protein
LAHRLRNLQSKVTEERWPEIRARVKACYEAPSTEVAKVLRDDFVARYQGEIPSAVKCFEDDFDACIAHLRFPITHRKVIRTTNLLERLFEEERRRMKIIANAFGERPVLKLMYASLLRASEHWRGLEISVFEMKQLERIRQELEDAHRRRHAPAVTSEGRVPSPKSSRNRT